MGFLRRLLEKPQLMTPVDKALYGLMWILRFSVVVAIIWSLVVGDVENLGISCIALVTTFVPALAEKRYKVALPIEFHLVILLFLYSTLFLGEVGNAYKKFWWWDMVLHASSGVVLSFAGFLILYVPYARQQLQMPFKLMAFFSFCMGLAAGALWEIYEFSSDVLLHTHMQHGNGDTMHDLLTDAIGALVFAVVGYYYLKNAPKSPIARLINSFVELNPRLFRTSRALKHSE
ncbi:MAG TPA: hypothetical protein VLF60_03965 [Candidatus Saccharimonadales bacterium]|nr:hypothetical protein [Candidatus Saccharimonadales bacterium]